MGLKFKIKRWTRWTRSQGINVINLDVKHKRNECVKVNAVTNCVLDEELIKLVNLNKLNKIKQSKRKDVQRI